MEYLMNSLKKNVIVDVKYKMMEYLKDNIMEYFIESLMELLKELIKMVKGGGLLSLRTERPHKEILSETSRATGISKKFKRKRRQ